MKTVTVPEAPAAARPAGFWTLVWAAVCTWWATCRQTSSYTISEEEFLANAKIFTVPDPGDPGEEEDETEPEGLTLFHPDYVVWQN